MIIDEKSSRAYDLHTRHLRRDAQFLGILESLSEAQEVISELSPNVYMFAEGCVTGEPSLQVATWDWVRRMNLSRLSLDERYQLVSWMEEQGIEYRQTRYLCLDRRFQLTSRGRFQKHFKPFYDLYCHLFH